MTQPKKRLIEVSLPLEAISKQSAREKFIRHGHISTLHIWWARRPLAAMRAAIFASLIPAPETEKERKDLEKLIKTIVDWDQVKDGNSEAILKARQLIQEAYPDGPPRLLDPFMGGGSTGLEALRLGCETHALELNPVAHLIELCTLVYPQKYGQMSVRKMQHGAVEVEQEVNPLAEDIRIWSNWVLERTREEIGDLYENPQGDETVVGYVWARTVQCPNPNCGIDMPLVGQWWLARRGNAKRIAVKPVIERAGKQIGFEVVRNTEIDFDPGEGTMRRGRVTCLNCGQTADSVYLKQEGREGRLQDVPLAVIIDRPGGIGKEYRAITAADRERYENSRRRLEDWVSREPSLLPREPITKEQPRLMWVILYGFERWEHLFNKRQSVALASFSRQVRLAYEQIKEHSDAEYARAIASYLGLIVDSIVDRNSVLCMWRSSSEDVGHTFGRQGLVMAWDYVETNPFSGSTGSWEQAVDKTVRVVEHAARASKSFAVVKQGTATNLSYEDNVMDAVITDPPYYDAVPYSHLSDFFYVWLKQTLGFAFAENFRTPLSPKGAEIVEQRPHRSLSSRKDSEFYERELTKAFCEARRVLKTDGIFTVVFAHKSVAAWETLISSLLSAGLVVTASWPLHTEMSSRLIARGTAALASSIFIVCRVREAEIEGYIDEVRDELQSVIKERLDFFWQEGIRGADFFISAIGPAVSVFGRYSKVYKLDGTEVGVGALLDLVQELVADYALDRILNGHRESVGAVDAATRYYILHRWSYGSTDVPFDDAMRLAMALGADIDALMDRRGVLKQSGETVKLLGPKQRGKREELGEVDRAGRPAPVVDVLHRAVTLWESGQREALARFLADNAHGREEQLRLVAQTLIDILPQDDRERRLLEGFLAGRDSVPDAPRQERLL